MGSIGYAAGAGLAGMVVGYGTVGGLAVGLGGDKVMDCYKGQ